MEAGGESKFNSLMSRYQTLYESNLDLFDSLITNSDKLKMLRNEYEKITIEHNSNKMKINSKLGEMQQIRDKLSLKNENIEEKLNRDGDKLRAKVHDLSRIYWGIDNIADKCMKQKYGKKQVESLTLDQKLECIVVNTKLNIFDIFIVYRDFVLENSFLLYYTFRLTMDPY